MPTNALRIVRSPDASFVVTAWGPDGVARDLTAHFQEITGPEALSPFTNKLTLKNGSFKTEIEFAASEMDLRYQLDEAVAKQLVAVAGVA